MTTVKSLLSTLAQFIACIVFSLGFVMACGHISANDIYNIFYPQPREQMTTIEAIGNAIEWFLIDYDDCSGEIVCTLATGLTPNESYVTPIMLSVGYSREQSEFILTLIVDTFEIYMG